MLELRVGRDGTLEDVDVGDEVWVMFPNVRMGRTRKLAFRMHGTYVVKEWLHGEKRVALLVHKDDENDTVLAHVDRMVRKKEVRKSLRDQWKPIRMELRGGSGGTPQSDGPREKGAGGAWSLESGAAWRGGCV